MNARPNGHTPGPVDFPPELAAEMEPAPAPIDAATWSTPEAPVSATARLTYRGHDVMVTLRGATGKDVLARLDSALTYLETHGATPASPPANGNGHADPGAPMCPTHGRPMKRNRRDDGWYCPAKIAEDDGAGKAVYCRQTTKDTPG